MKNRGWALGILAAGGALAFACHESPGEDLLLPPAMGSAGSESLAVAGAPDGAGINTTTPVEASHPPPPVSGGNLLVTRDGTRAVVADTDRDRLVVVDVAQRKVTATVALMTGDQPGRLVEDAAGRVHVALRGGGAVATLDLASGKLAARRSVCAGPRGLAFDGHDSLVVACADGRVVTLPSAEGEATRSVFVEADLRDVIFKKDGLWVSTFKSAKLLHLDDAGKVDNQVVVPDAQVFATGSKDMAAFQAEVAWRAAPFGDGIVVLHQLAQLAPINVGDAPSMDPGASAYGSNGQCGAVVRSALSVVGADGKPQTGQVLGGGTLPVDFDISASGRVAVAFAGSGGGRAPGGGKFGDDIAMFTVLEGNAVPLSAVGVSSGAGGAGSTDIGAAGSGGAIFAPSPVNCAQASALTNVDQPVVALRFVPGHEEQLLLLGRNPARVYFVDTDRPGSVAAALDLGGEDVSDTGHSLFHDDAGAGIACASCHPEGTEDGHVWSFSGFGPRRTQALNAGLAKTAPYHWDGTLADVGAVMTEVFVKRMGGEQQSPERVAALQRWLFALPSLPSLRASDDAAAERGAALFESVDVGCARCHAGEAFTNNTTVKVSTDALQVPSLIGIAHRAPFMHDGCALTLLDRFGPCGGGEEHGHTAQLSQAQIADLVAYLETL